MKFGDQFAASATGSWTRRNGVGDFVNLDTSKDVGEMTGLVSPRRSQMDADRRLFNPCRL